MLRAGLGRIAPRGKGGRRGWAASENREEGRILEAQDKQIVPLHVRGGGGGAGGERTPRPRLFPSPKPALCHRGPARAPGASPRRYGYYPRRRGPTREVRDCQPHPARASRAGPCAADRGAVCQGNKAHRAPRFPPPGGPRTQHAALTRAASGGKGLQTPSSSFRPPPPQKESTRTGERR